VEARDKNPDPTVEPDYDTYVTNLINEWSGFSALRTFTSRWSYLFSHLYT